MLRTKLQQQGFSRLRDEGVALAVAGRTSLEEVLRATHLDDDAPDPRTQDDEGAERHVERSEAA